MYESEVGLKAIWVMEKVCIIVRHSNTERICTYIVVILYIRFIVYKIRIIWF